MTAAAPHVFNVWVPGCHCRTWLRPAEQKSFSGLTDPRWVQSCAPCRGQFPVDVLQRFCLYKSAPIVAVATACSRLPPRRRGWTLCSKAGPPAVAEGSRKGGKGCFKISQSLMCQCHATGWEQDPLERPQMGSRGLSITSPPPISEHRGQLCL